MVTRVELDIESSPVGPRAVRRLDGFVAIGEYAAIGDGRTVALVAPDGTIDWLCLPDLDSPPVFAALLDADRGGRFVVAPDVKFSVTRRYLPLTNVLETTFHTDRGTVRVTDALTVPRGGLFPMRELVRVVDGVDGEVPMRWLIDPCVALGRTRPGLRVRGDVAIVDARADALSVRAWDAGAVAVKSGTLTGRFETGPGSRSMLALSAAHQEPVVIPTRRDVEDRLEHTLSVWRDWAGSRRHDGPWSDAVLRSALALKLLVYAPSGAVAAAATTSLPEQLGGTRNWDYRFCWVRDAAFIMNALLQLGCAPEATSFFWWLMHASQLTQPRLQVLYRLNGDPSAPEHVVTSFSGYRGSRPVRIGNGAVDQVQLDVYGDLMHAAWLYANAGHDFDTEIGHRLANTATLVSRIWHEPDAGIWEVRSQPEHFTQSKMMCWVALDRAIRLAERGHIPGGHIPRWRSAMDDIRRFVDDHCWSYSHNTYTRYASSDELDASLLLGVLFEYGGRQSPRMQSTVDAIRRELTAGPFVRRYTGDDGLGGREGAFVACSLWLVEALARLGHGRDAATLLDQLVAQANDVGLYAEEIDPATGEFLGNFPQGLTHLALINAAVALTDGLN